MGRVRVRVRGASVCLALGRKAAAMRSWSGLGVRPTFGCAHTRWGLKERTRVLSIEVARERAT